MTQEPAMDPQVPLDRLDYHDLRAFWAVVREGSMAGAAAALHVGRPAVSMRVKALETALAQRLFDRRGRHLELTETGSLVFEYADDIFRLGRELESALARPSGPAPGRRGHLLRIGVVQSVPKLAAFELLAPALADPELVVQCHQGSPSGLLTRLGSNELDLVLTDAPLGESDDASAVHHPLGDSAVGLFGAPDLALASRAAQHDPRLLADVPVLLPMRGQSLRRLVDSWFERESIRPRVVGEFDDSALLKAFGRTGRGLFPAPTTSSDAIERGYGCIEALTLSGVRERFYAVTGERRLQHPGVERLIRPTRETGTGQRE
ncbi:LysR family transcriptional regulator [Planctomycetes bacterium Pla163]